MKAMATIRGCGKRRFARALLAQAGLVCLGVALLAACKIKVPGQDGPPDAPKSLSATAVSDSEVNLAWQDMSDNEDAFELQRKEEPAGSYAEIAEVGANVVTCSNSSGLDAKTSYSYRVRAVNAFGESSWSNEAQTTTRGSPSGPDNLAAAAASDSAIDLSWADNSDDETGFWIERKEGAAGAFGWIASPGADATSYQDTLLSQNTDYTYRIKALNTYGDSTWSGEASARTQGVPDADPTNPRLVARQDRTMSFSWTDNSSNEEKYWIDRRINSGAWTVDYASVDAGTTTFADSGMVYDTVYSYRVRGRNTYGDSGYSGPVSEKTLNKVIASDRGSGDLFGWAASVSSDGSTVVAGAQSDDDLGSAAGAAYVYEWTGSGWDETKLKASDGAADDNFGCSVAVSGDGETVVVGAYKHDGGKGAAYVYTWGGSSWAETKLSPAETDNDIYFGMSVDISADAGHIAVGGTLADGMDSDCGAVYVYTWNGSSATLKGSRIIASDGYTGDLFGLDVAISDNGNVVATGASGSGAGSSGTGSVYVYRWISSAWSQHEINASNAGEDDIFGRSVALSGDGNTLLTGAEYEDTKGYNAGMAYVYKWGGSLWTETKLTASDGAAADYFGNSVGVSADGNELAVSGPYDDDKGGSSGSIYYFEWTGSAWAETKITASDGASNDKLGYKPGATNISDNGLVIAAGAGYDDGRGSVYIFKP